MTNFCTNSKIKGNWGETLASQYLEKMGFTIIGRNMRIKSKEADIVANYNKEIHFIEVKTRFFDQSNRFLSAKQIVNFKIFRLAYCRKFNLKIERTSWDLIQIIINKKNKIAKLSYFKDIFI
ncbi:MAG: YraN family protein [Planctomycetes bacterium]|jgi:putative endonuclease|nr:YraN family protein [Planctomycetota bacterium]